MFHVYLWILCWICYQCERHGQQQTKTFILNGSEGNCCDPTPCQDTPYCHEEGYGKLLNNIQIWDLGEFIVAEHIYNQDMKSGLA